ncbi:hypothetical protein V866_008406 [Kwoniella sp. B9012]
MTSSNSKTKALLRRIPGFRSANNRSTTSQISQSSDHAFKTNASYGTLGPFTSDNDPSGKTSFFTIKCRTEGIESLRAPDWLQTISATIQVSENLETMGLSTENQFCLHKESKCDKPPAPFRRESQQWFFPHSHNRDRVTLPEAFFIDGNSTHTMPGYPPENTVRKLLEDTLLNQTIEPYSEQHQPGQDCSVETSKHVISLLPKDDFARYRNDLADTPKGQSLKLHAHCPLDERGILYSIKDVRDKDIRSSFPPEGEGDEPFEEKVAYEIDIDWNDVVDPSLTGPEHPIDDVTHLIAGKIETFERSPGWYSLSRP